MTDTLHRFSCSQRDTFKDCQRKWGLEKIDKHPKPANKYAEHGKRLHKKLERYLQSGEIGDPLTDPDVKIILAGIHDLPKPGHGNVEGEFLYTFPGICNVKGFIDLEYIDQDGVPIVRDHKTTSDLRWAKSIETLKTDTQVLIYSKYIQKKYKADRIRARWGYFTRNPQRPKYMPVQIELQSQDIDRGLLPILDDFKNMGEIIDSGVKGESLPPTLSACDKYGGCGYKLNGVCKLSNAQRLKGLVENMSMRDRAKQHKAAKNVVETEDERPNPKKPRLSPEDIFSDEEPEQEVPKSGKHLSPEDIFSDEEPPVKINPPKKQLTPEDILDHGYVEDKKPLTPENIFEDEQPPTREEKKTEKSKKQNFLIGKLFINCLPLNNELRYENFFDLLKKANDTVLNDHGVPHYRLIPNQYGATPVILQQYLNKVLEEEPIEGLFLDLNAPEAKDAVAYLQTVSNIVIKGI